MASPPKPSCLQCEFYCEGICAAEPDRALTVAREISRAEVEALDAEAVARIHRYVVGAICRMTGEFQTAADLAQDVFVKALGAMDGFRHDARLTTWIYAIARNRCFDYLKERAARREVGGEVLDDVHPVVDNEALRTIERDEARRIVQTLMQQARLEPEERRAFLMHYAGDVSLDEVARRLGLQNRSGAKAPIVSARRKLARAVTRWRAITSFSRPPAPENPTLHLGTV